MQIPGSTRYCFFVISHGRRNILHFNITEHPTGSWIVQQLREAFPEDRAPRYLILDWDCKFQGEVATMLEVLGSELIRTAYRSPWQNGVAERWVGSCRRELSPRAYGPRNLMKVAGVATKWKRNVAATQALNPLLSVGLSRLSTLSLRAFGPRNFMKMLVVHFQCQRILLPSIFDRVTQGLRPAKPHESRWSGDQMET